jgi:hypothetical protein
MEEEEKREEYEEAQLSVSKARLIWGWRCWGAALPSLDRPPSPSIIVVGVAEARGR